MVSFNRYKVLISLFILALSVTAKSSTILEDLEVENRADWDCFSDQVMGGVSEGKASVVSSEDNKFFRLEEMQQLKIMTWFYSVQGH